MARILVVDDTPISVQLMNLTLTKQGHEVRSADNGAQGVAAAKEWRPDLVIMDVMMPEMDGYEATRRIRANTPTALTPIIVVTAQDTLEEKMAAFEAGADDYMSKPFEPVELIARVEVHLKRAQLAPSGLGPGRPKAAGFVLACFSLRGGSGVSTLASSLAVSLAQTWSQPTLLLDMVLVGGHAALLLNVPASRSWADMAGSPPEEFDAAYVNQHLIAHQSGVRVLPSPVHVREAELVNPEHVKAALDILQANYDLLVADLPHDFRDTTLAVLDRSAVILMPFSPELASIRSVAAALEVFQALEYAPEQIRLILNWTFPKSGLPPPEIEKALKKKIDLTLSYDRDLLIRSINKGEPVTLGEVTSPLGVQLEDYAYALTREVAGGLASDTPSDAWRRVTQRSGKPSPSKKS